MPGGVGGNEGNNPSFPARFFVVCEGWKGERKLRELRKLRLEICGLLRSVILACAEMTERDDLNCTTFGLCDKKTLYLS